MGAKDFAEKYLELGEVPEFVKRDAEKIAADNIYVLTSDGVAICGSCNKHIQVKVKHKERCKCPECGRDMTVQHVWRMSKYIEEYAWVTHSQRLDDKCVVIRFVRAYRRPKKEDYSGATLADIKGTPWETEELARLYYHENYANAGIYQRYSSNCEWRRESAGWFRPDTYSIMCHNPQWCLYAYQDEKNAIEQFSGLDCFKYYPLKDIWDKDKGIYQIHYLMRTARINEKLKKQGLTKLIHLQEQYYEYSRDYAWYKGRAWLYGDKPVMKTLRLDKRRYNMFIKNPSKEYLDILRRFKDVTEEELAEYKSDWRYFAAVADLAKTLNVTRYKVKKYLSKKGSPSLWEYNHYLDLLKKHGTYDLTDPYYSMPSDFRKADAKITDEWNDMQARERAKSVIDKIKDQAKVDESIYQISQLIRNCEELKFWTHGSNGLKVIVPESVGELVDEGIKLHNCLSTYAEKIADKETLIFFIRRLDDPNKEYIAMEYKDGRRVQIRFDHNIEVEDEKILQFADAFTKQLNEMQIMKKVKHIKQTKKVA